MASVFPIVDQFCMALLNGRPGRLTAQNGGFRPGRAGHTAEGCERAELVGVVPHGGHHRVRSHCRFRNRVTDSLSEYGMKWMSGSTKRQCDRTLGDQRAGLNEEPVPLGPDVLEAEHHALRREGLRGPEVRPPKTNQNQNKQKNARTLAPALCSFCLGPLPGRALCWEGARLTFTPGRYLIQTLSENLSPAQGGEDAPADAAS